jgi:WD40 repeat protein
MSPFPESTSDREQRVNAAIAAYLEAVESGQTPERRDFLAHHVDIAEELQAFFSARDQFRNAAGHLWSLETPGDPPPPGTGMGTVRYFGDYELLEEIARGGMGLVYKARQVSLNRVVALKMILAGQLASPAEVQRFRTEAESAASLDHPNIVPIYEIGEHQGRHYFSMKLIEGGSLAQKIPELMTSPKAAVRLLATVARAVHFAHQRRILHRDLKPSNILLDATGAPHITDFGLAKRFAEEQGLTQSGAIVGTPSYMAPEQAAGKKTVQTTAVDVYSLGAILYELLTGQPPFQAETQLETLLQVMEQEPRQPRSLQRSIDRDLETICLHCLQKDPRQRYGSAEALAEDLERWLAGEPIQARRTKPLERLVKWVRRKPAWAALTAGLALALVGVLVSNWRLAQEHQARLAQEIRAEGESKLAEERQWHSLYEKARAERLAGNWGAAQETLATAARLNPTNELREEAIRSLAVPDVRLVREIPVGHVFSMKFSSDGRVLAIHGKYPASSAEKMNEVDEQRLQFWPIPSGQVFGNTELTGQADGLSVGMTGFGSHFQYTPYVLQPATLLTMLVPPDGNNLRLWDPSAAKYVGEFPGTFYPPVFSPDGKRLAIRNGTAVEVWDIVQQRLVEDFVSEQPLAFLSSKELKVMYHEGLGKLSLHTGQVTALTPSGMTLLAISADGRVAALCDHNAKPGDPVKVWNVIEGRELAMLPAAPLNRVPFGLHLSPDGQLLAWDDPFRPNSFHIWDGESGQVRSGFRGAIYGAGNWNFLQRGAFHRSGRLLAAYERRGRNVLNIWDVDGERVVATLRSNHSPVWSDDGRLLATIGSGRVTRPDGSPFTEGRNVVRVWEATSPLPRYELGEPVESLSFDAAGTRLAANSTVLDVAEPAAHFRPPLKPPAADSLMVFRGGGALWQVSFPTSINDNSEIKLGRLTAPRQNVPLPIPTPERPNFVPGNATAKLTTNRRGVAVGPLGNSLAVTCQIMWKGDGASGSYIGDNNGLLLLWKSGTEAPRSLGVHAPECVAMSPDGRLVATGGNEGVDLWSTPGKHLHRYQYGLTSNAELTDYGMRESASPPYRYIFKSPCVLFSPDSRRLYSGGSDGRVNVGDVETGEEVGSWSGHTGSVLALAISPDGRVLASGGEDHRVRLWDPGTGQELVRWEAHDDAVTALAFRADGNLLASGSADGTVHLWDLPSLRQKLTKLGLGW